LSNNNNIYNNNHLYQHHHHINSTTSLSGSVHNSKHNNSSTSSGTATAITAHHPTPIEGLTALSSLGSSALHLTTNSLCGGSSNSLGSELVMSNWLSDGPSNSGKLLNAFFGI